MQQEKKVALKRPIEKFMIFVLFFVPCVGAKNQHFPYGRQTLNHFLGGFFINVFSFVSSEFIGIIEINFDFKNICRLLLFLHDMIYRFRKRAYKHKNHPNAVISFYEFNS